nr:Chain B, Sonic hedgehog protein N-product peptide [Homo sapiens]
CGPGRGFG